MVAARDRSGRRPSISVGAALAGALLVTACGGPGEPAADAASPTAIVTAVPTTTTIAPSTTTSTRAPTTTTAPPTTTNSTIPPTTPSTTPSTSPSTTAAPTTSTEPLTTLALEHVEPVDVQATEPIAPPLDQYGDEPVVEVGTIAIPKIGVEMPMYEGIRLTTLDRGPGHWPGTARPGQVGNVVVGGHRTSGHRVFRHVDQLDPGDEIVFTDAAGSHTYLVDRVEIIEPTDVWIVDPTETPTATLFACHPPGSTAQRIAVFADLADE